MKNTDKEFILTVLYFPVQLLIGLLFSPGLVLLFAVLRSKDIAFDDVWVNEDNPLINPAGPAMKRKKNHCWLKRFLCPWI